MREINAILAIAQRDLLKFLRDGLRIVSTFIFPVVFIGILGGTFDAGFGELFGYNLLNFTFSGVLAQTLFQSSAIGLISLIEDRENDFSQEIFISPISRYSIIFGKILGETLVSLAQGVGIIAFALIIGVPLSLGQLLLFVPIALIVCFLGGAFGVLIMANLTSQRAANQVFPFIMLPQYFLAGVFTPINNLPPALNFLSHLAPMRYAVDLSRGALYSGSPEYGRVVLDNPLFNLTVIGLLFVVFLVVGTFLFVRKERNR